MTVSDTKQRLIRYLSGEMIGTSLGVSLELVKYGVLAELEHQVKTTLSSENFEKAHQVLMF